jgi:hypothetical protein
MNIPFTSGQQFKAVNTGTIDTIVSANSEFVQYRANWMSPNHKPVQIPLAGALLWVSCGTWVEIKEDKESTPGEKFSARTKFEKKAYQIFKIEELSWEETTALIIALCQQNNVQFSTEFDGRQWDDVNNGSIKTQENFIYASVYFFNYSQIKAS